MRRPGSATLTALVILGVATGLVVSCGGSTTAAPRSRTRVVVTDAAFPVALTLERGGSVLYAERRTGRVRRVGRTGRLDPEPVARVAVATTGQRGLLGVATDPAGRVFVAFTGRGTGRPITVAEVVPQYRTVWTGPSSSRLANGGHLVHDTSRGRLVIGIGDLERRARVEDPDAPNGKLLLLDPDGPPTQRPVVLSQGWNNPFAFTLTPAGALWVADNVPGRRGERLARGDRQGRPTLVTRLPENTVPAALAAPSDRVLVVCGFARGRAERYQITGGRARPASGVGDGVPCRTGITPGRGAVALWLADERSVRVLPRR